MRQRLNHVVCLSLMRDAEATDGIDYTLYARIRLDSMFFAPLPPSVLESALVPWTAVVPAGDAWGGNPNNLGVCDRMLIGRWKAFSTDVYGWKAFFRRNSSHLSGRDLVGETYQRAILEHAKGLHRPGEDGVRHPLGRWESPVCGTPIKRTGCLRPRAAT